MSEVGIAYVLTGPDGTRAVVGNCDAARLDPDFIGYLNPENGVTGLLDTAAVRESSQDLVAADGARHGPFWEGRRSGTINGVLLPNAGDMAIINRAERKLKRALRALRDDTTMVWTPTGESIPRMLRVRRQAEVRCAGRRPKTFMAALVSEHSHILSADEVQQTITPDSTIDVLGITSPLTAPFATTISPTGLTLVNNIGDVETWPRFVIHGPISAPAILNFTTGKQITFATTLDVDEFLVINAHTASVLLGFDSVPTLTDRYSFYAGSPSDWWPLVPGVNDLRLLATAYSAGAYMTVLWRHAWE
jgi:hypothetical protein